MESEHLVCKDKLAVVLDNHRDIKSNISMGETIDESEAGPYQCIAWNEELSKHVYSEVLNIDDCKFIFKC